MCRDVQAFTVNDSGAFFFSSHKVVPYMISDVYTFIYIQIYNGVLWEEGHMFKHSR